jgi:hypothetical protein
MTTPEGSAIRRLRDALDRIGAALVSFQLDDLLAVQPVLAAALDEVGRTGAGGLDAATIAAEVSETRQALGRCLRLGESLHEATRIVLTARGASWHYDRTGRERGSDLAATTVEARA